MKRDNGCEIKEFSNLNRKRSSFRCLKDCTVSCPVHRKHFSYCTRLKSLNTALTTFMVNMVLSMDMLLSYMYMLMLTSGPPASAIRSVGPVHMPLLCALSMEKSVCPPYFQHQAIVKNVGRYIVSTKRLLVRSQAELFQVEARESFV